MNTSLPSRGAWIEICTTIGVFPPPVVAPLAGSVDRNVYFGHTMGMSREVAPLAGSVDRNTPPRIASAKAAMSRSPRGERG